MSVTVRNFFIYNVILVPQSRAKISDQFFAFHGIRPEMFRFAQHDSVFVVRISLVLSPLYSWLRIAPLGGFG